MTAIRIFISYAHEDETWLQQWLDEKQQKKNRRYFLDFWERSLRAEKEECIFWWDRAEDDGLRGGDRWRSRILEEIARADVAVLLISQDFVISPFIMGEELPQILAQARRGETEVVPILLSPAQWEKLELHGVFQLTPGKPTPLSRYLDAGEDEWQSARLEVVGALVAAVKRARRRCETEIPLASPPSPLAVPLSFNPRSPRPSIVGRSWMSHWRMLAAIATLAVLAVGVASAGWWSCASTGQMPAKMQPSASALAEKSQESLSAEGDASGEMVRIPGGTFMMGSIDGYNDTRPIHQVRISAFDIDKTEVTVTQYAQCVRSGPCSEPHSGDEDDNWGKAGRENHPVNSVDWRQANAFCHWTGKRLPSEAEWEYAARSGGKQIVYPWGKQLATCEYAILFVTGPTSAGGGRGCGEGRSWPVCSKAKGKTEQDLCDMAGNVREWVEDDWHSSYSDAPVDGTAWIDTPARVWRRVLRGGGWWDSDGRGVRADRRYDLNSDQRGYDVGFRCARNVL